MFSNFCFKGNSPVLYYLLSVIKIIECNIESEAHDFKQLLFFFSNLLAELTKSIWNNFA